MRGGCVETCESIVSVVELESKAKREWGRKIQFTLFTMGPVLPVNENWRNLQGGQLDENTVIEFSVGFGGS